MDKSLKRDVIAYLAQRDSDDLHDLLAAHSAVAWRRCSDWLDTAGVALYLAAKLERLGHWPALPRSLAQRLQANAADYASHVAGMSDEYARVNRAFLSLGVPYANMKGLSLVPEFCPHAALRLQLDFDFLVRPADRNAFDACIRSLGYVQVNDTGEEVGYENLPGHHYSRKILYRPKPHRKIELHFRLGASNGNGRFQGPADCLARTRIGAHGFPALSRTDAFLNQAFHLLQHLMEGHVRISWLLEFAHFANSLSPQDGFWKELQASAGGDAALAIGIAAGLVRQVLRSTVPGPLSWTQSALSPALHRWLQWHGEDFALAPFPGSKLQLLILRELQGESAASAARRERVFPLRIPEGLRHIQKTPAGSRASLWAMRWSYFWMRLKFHCRENPLYFRAARAWKQEA